MLFRSAVVASFAVVERVNVVHCDDVAELCNMLPGVVAPPVRVSEHVGEGANSAIVAIGVVGHEVLKRRRSVFVLRVSCSLDVAGNRGLFPIVP